MRPLPLLCAASVSLLVLGLGTPGGASSPSSGSLGGKSKSVTWSGSATLSNPVACAGASDPTCDHFQLTLDGIKKQQDVLVAIAGAEEGDDWDLFVYGPDGALVASSATSSGNEQVRIDGVPSGVYEVRVQPFVVTPGARYDGRASIVRAGGAPIDVERECLEPVPAAFSPETSPDIALTVSVLLDGVGLARGEELVETATASYAPLGVTLSAVGFQSVSFEGDDAQGLIDQGKEHFGGERPSGSDLVYVLTDKNIQLGGNTAVAGLADCIGGVRFPETAFAVGEDIPDADTPLDHSVAAKVLAHELGHLMGGHHHYANCVEGNLGPDDEGEVSPCTLMINVVDLASLNFSVLNGVVVRGHGEEWAD